MLVIPTIASIVDPESAPPIMEGKLYPAASFWVSARPPIDRAAAIATKSRHAPLNLKRFMTLLQRMTLLIYYPSVDPIYKLSQALSSSIAVISTGYQLVYGPRLCFSFINLLLHQGASQAQGLRKRRVHLSAGLRLISAPASPIVLGNYRDARGEILTA